MPITIFPNERVLLSVPVSSEYADSEGNGYGETFEYLISCEALRSVLSDSIVKGERAYVTVDREGRTDYPHVYKDGTWALDYTERLTTEFRALLREYFNSIP